MKGTAELEQELLRLPAAERARLVLRAWESLADDPAAAADPLLDPEGLSIALERDAEIDAGSVETIDDGEFRRMHALDILGDPVRRRILELLAGGERTSGQIVEVVGVEFGITQAAVSQHLKVLRDNGFATVRPEGTRRIYGVDPAPLQEIDRCLNRFRHFWEPKLDALATEIARGKRKRNRAGK